MGFTLVNRRPRDLSLLILRKCDQWHNDQASRGIVDPSVDFPLSIDYFIQVFDRGEENTDVEHTVTITQAGAGIACLFHFENRR